MVKAPKFCHVTPILKSLHWLKINERIEYKLLSLTYKALTTARTTYLHSLISVQSPRATRPSSVVTLSRPSRWVKNHQLLISLCITSSLELPVSFRQPCTKHPHDDVTLTNSPPTCSVLTTLTLHHTFTVSFQAQNSPFPQIFSTIVC